MNIPTKFFLISLLVVFLYCIYSIGSVDNMAIFRTGPDKIFNKNYRSLCNYDGTGRSTINREELIEIMNKHIDWVRSIGAKNLIFRPPLELHINNNGTKDGRRAVFCDFQMQNLDFSGLNLSFSLFLFSDLRRSKFSNARLFFTTFESTCLAHADFQNSMLDHTSFLNSMLPRANFEDASVRYPWFYNSTLSGVNFNNASISGGKWWYSVYNIEKDPRPDFQNEEGMWSMTFYDFPSISDLNGCYTDINTISSASSLYRLRKSLQDTGLRDLGKEITHAIEHTKTELKFVPRSFNWIERINSYVEGYLRTILFDFTSQYGMSPNRALFILAYSIVFFAIFYQAAIIHRKPGSDHGLFRVFPSERFNETPEGFVFHDKKIEVIDFSFWTSYRYALLFSLCSAFHIGWREFNVGTWIGRLQSEDFTLVALGWPRVLAGVQSLLSVYLVAIWALTFFGNPFD